MAFTRQNIQICPTIFNWILPALFIGLISITPARAQGDVFTVSDVKVDVTAKNALAAREQAFDQAQQDAFGIMAGRMLSESSAANFTPPSSDIISRMIQDYEVTNEKISAVRYIGTYTIRFNDHEVSRYFGGRNVQRNGQYVSMKQKPLLILPFYEYNGKNVIWSPHNAWMSAWTGTKNIGGIAPLSVPMGDIEDVRDIDDNEALNYNQNALRSMLSRYQAGEAVIVIAVPDHNLKNADLNAPANGGLTVQLYRTDRTSPEFVAALQIEPSGNMTKAQLLNKAVADVKVALQKDWKNPAMQKPQVPQGSRVTYRVEAPLRNLNHWSSIQKAMQNVRPLENLTILSISPRIASMQFDFAGDAKQLALIFAQSGLSLTQNANIGSNQQIPSYQISLSANINGAYTGTPTSVKRF